MDDNIQSQSATRFFFASDKSHLLDASTKVSFDHDAVPINENFSNVVYQILFSTRCALRRCSVFRDHFHDVSNLLV